MSALHPAMLAWPFALLVGVPLVIHLINLLRRRKVRWAAMEFLLASQKKNRRRVVLQQWMLIAARMFAVGLALLLLAGMVLSGDWARLFGRGEAHHVIIVDDSLSMAAGAGFDRARQAAERLARQIAQENAPQRVTLLPYTVVADQTWNAEQDLFAQSVDPQRLAAEIETRLRDWRPTQLATSPLAVLEGVERLLAQGHAGEERTVHLVTDFRTGDWNNVPAVRQRLERLADSGVKLHLINTTFAPASNAAGPSFAEPNVALGEVRLLPGARAAGVPQMIEVAVTNFGPAAVSDVAVETSYRPLASAKSGDSSATTQFPASDPPWTSLPTVEFDEIKSGETATARVQVRFPAAGDYAMRATLAGAFLATADRLAEDNVRFGVASIALDVPVLVIDGDPRDDDALHVATALRPGGATRTGINVTVKPATSLRDQPLNGFAAVYLLDVGRLEQSVIESLESYARRGGGVVFFVGPNAHRTSINDTLFRDGAGLFPVVVEGPAELPFALASESSESSERPGADRTAADIAFDRRGALARLIKSANLTFPTIPGTSYDLYSDDFVYKVITDTSGTVYKDTTIIISPEQLHEIGPFMRPYVQSEEKTKSVSTVLVYDINIKTVKNAFVNVNINSLTQQQLLGEIKADLKVNNETNNQLQVFGDLNIVGDSYFRFYRNFKVDNSRVSFSGNPSNPYISIHAVYNATSGSKGLTDDEDQGVQIVLDITGTAERPELKLRMFDGGTEVTGKEAQSDAISYLLFGVSKGNLKPGQRSALVQNIGATTGSTYLSGLLTGAIRNIAPFIINTEVNYTEGNLASGTDIRITSEVGDAIVKFGGKVFSGLDNTEVSIEYPLNKLLHMDLSNNLILEISRTVEESSLEGTRSVQTGVKLVYKIKY